MVMVTHLYAENKMRRNRKMAGGSSHQTTRGGNFPRTIVLPTDRREESGEKKQSPNW